MGKYEYKRRYMETWFSEYQTEEYNTKEECLHRLREIMATVDYEYYEIGKLFIVTITREKNEVMVGRK